MIETGRESERKGVGVPSKAYREERREKKREWVERRGGQGERENEREKAET